MWIISKKKKKNKENKSTSLSIYLLLLLRQNLKLYTILINLTFFNLLFIF